MFIVGYVGSYIQFLVLVLVICSFTNVFQKQPATCTRCPSSWADRVWCAGRVCLKCTALKGLLNLQTGVSCLILQSLFLLVYSMGTYLNNVVHSNFHISKYSIFYIELNNFLSKIIHESSVEY